MPYIGKQLVRGQNRKLDDISSGFNGSQTTFTLQVASQNVTVGSALQLWISLGGVIQDPLSDYTIAGNQLTFTTAPAASLDFFGVIQGDVTDTNTPGDATVTTSKLATGLTVNLADGSAATSSLQLGGTDSGLFSSAADKVNVTTGGVERLEIGDSEVVFNDPSNDVDFRVESNGNTHMLFVDAGNDRVGVGSSSPSSPLTVQSDSSTNGIAVLGRSADDISTTLFFENDGTTQIGRLQARQSYFQISGTDNTKGIFIDNAGEVGIGTSSPTALLHISKTVNSGDVGLIIQNTGTSSQTASLYLNKGSGGEPDHRIQNDTGGNLTFARGTDESSYTEQMRIDSVGNVGIGTSTIEANSNYNTLEIVGDTSSGGGVVRLKTGDRSTAKTMLFCDTGGFEARVETNHPLVLSTNNTTRLTISNVGKFTAPTIYSLTTTGGSAVYVESDGDLLRFTSSLKYKTDVETIEDARADAILNCRPVWYRSTCKNDIKTEGAGKSDWGWYGFIAEEVAEIEPRLVSWATKDAVKQEDGSLESVERDPADYEAEGVRYDNFVPLLVNLVKRQQAAIETLEAKVAALEAK